ncbi:hypothetical protein SKC37_09235 [Aquirufa sp. HETE-83D]|uniref:Uncharacterized protein n=1 Tax=Aquirufa esocilacus TaxID=3096513 RepID=A0ABW6DQ14_9BACT
MEVHHHTHHPKSWKEYVQEFLMLFFAVFLGFMAEYYLEYRAERHKEHDYLVSMKEDLKADLVEMDSKEFRMGEIINAANKLNEVIFKPTWNEADIDSIYLNSIIMVTRVYNIDFSSGTIDQLRNAGGFRLIQNEKIVRKISEYEKGKVTMNVQLDQLLERGANVHRIQNAVLQTTVFSTKESIGKFGFDRVLLDRIKKQTGSAFLTSNKNAFHEYANTTGTMKGYISYYILMSNNQKQKAKELISLLEEELAH